MGMVLRAALLWMTTLPTAAAAAPNILVLLTDDQGWGDNEYNCENSTGMCALTPNIRRLAMSSHTAIFHRFYAASPVCSPTRASILTGRTNNRNCINDALNCCQEDPAPTCSMSRDGGLSHAEFTIAKAAKRSGLGNYATLHLGKWHLGDLWNKHLPTPHPGRPGWPVSSPSDHGYDEWLSTQAEASNSMSNCGCFPVHHSKPGPQPPSGYPVNPHGDQCIVGGGAPSDWCYPCTNYYYPNASDPRGVTDLQYKIPGDDSTFLIDRFEEFLDRQVAAKRPWLAHLCFHAIHEPHPAMPDFYHLYSKDPDYLGALTMWDKQIGRLLQLLHDRDVYDNTVIFYTSDNGPHQGAERSDIHYSTNFLRQCKASIWEGGIRVPGFIHHPLKIKRNLNISTPATSSDFLPTIMSILQVTSTNPTWTMDGLDLMPLIEDSSHGASVARKKPIGFWTGEQKALVDNNWKIIRSPKQGQCSFQPPYNRWKNLSKATMLFDLDTDQHELHDLSLQQPEQLARMQGLLDDFLSSVANSQENETHCGRYSPPPSSSECSWSNDTGLDGGDIAEAEVASKEECCGLCRANKACAASCLTTAGICHLKSSFRPKARFDGSISCLPHSGVLFAI